MPSTNLFHYHAGARQACVLMCCWFLSIFLNYINAQPITKTETRHSGGTVVGTKAITITVDESLNKVITIEYRNTKGVVDSRATLKKDLQGKWTVLFDVLKPSGKIECSSKAKYDAEFKLLEFEADAFKGKKIVKDDKYYKPADGKTWDKESKKGSDTLFDMVEWGQSLRFLFYDAGEIPKPSKDASTVPKETDKSPRDARVSALDPGDMPCSRPGSNCQPQFTVFAGPGVLMGDYVQDKETFWGGKLTAAYHINQRVSLGIDASLFSKKVEQANFSRSFVMIEGTYLFGDVNNCDRKIVPDVHLLAGLASEKYKYGGYKSTGNGFAFGGGVGVTYKMSGPVNLFVQTDLVAVKFKDSDDLNKNFAFSAGVMVVLPKPTQLARRSKNDIESLQY